MKRYLVFAANYRDFIDWIKTFEERPTARMINDECDIVGYKVSEDNPIILVFLHRCWENPNYNKTIRHINRIIP